MKKLILLFAILAQTAWGQTLTVSGTTYNITGSELLTITNSWSEGFGVGNQFHSRTTFESCNSGLWRRIGFPDSGIGDFWELTPTALYSVFNEEESYSVDVFPQFFRNGSVNNCNRFVYLDISDSGRTTWTLERIDEFNLRVTVVNIYNDEYPDETFIITYRRANIREFIEFLNQ